MNEQEEVVIRFEFRFVRHPSRIECTELSVT